MVIKPGDIVEAHYAPMDEYVHTVPGTKWIVVRVFAGSTAIEMSSLRYRDSILKHLQSGDSLMSTEIELGQRYSAYIRDFNVVGSIFSFKTNKEAANSLLRR